MSERKILSDEEIEGYEKNTAFCRRLGSENMDGISALNLVGDCETLLASHRALKTTLSAYKQAVYVFENGGSAALAHAAIREAD